MTGRSAGAWAAVACLLAAGCSSSGTASGQPAASRPARGGVATIATLRGSDADWIFPFESVLYANAANIDDFQQLMYRPLYFFGGDDESVEVNYQLSAARPPVFRDGGTVVVITLKHWKWSDGESVDSQDVIFWLHMMEAEKDSWFGYVPGLIPDNIASMAITGRWQVTLTLTRPYSATWFTDNELSQITPMPMAWDISAAGGAPGSGGCTTDSAGDHWAKCKAVYQYLTMLARNTRDYASAGSIWATEDGPWKLSSYNIAGPITFVPNPKYSGSPRPYLSELKFVTYPTDAAELGALRHSSPVDVAAVPQAGLAAKAAGPQMPVHAAVLPGFRLEASYQYGVNFFYINFHNPVYGPVFRQLYFRQALQYLVDQNAIIADTMGGYGYPTTGPVPDEPPTRWLSPAQRGQGPYPFSIAKAKSLMTSHGWTEINGIDTCTRPGVAAGDCGAGIKGGLRLSLNLTFAALGQQSAQATIYAADAARAGIRLAGSYYGETLAGEPTPCSGPACTWEMLDFGGWTYSPDYAPTGEDLFLTGSGLNVGSYSSATMNSLIAATQDSSSAAAYMRYATYAADQLPVIWVPVPFQVVAVRSALHGVEQSPLGALVPEDWYYTKSS
jgi:peptide/nickel transport system substrate-binding protein